LNNINYTETSFLINNTAAALSRGCLHALKALLFPKKKILFDQFFSTARVSYVTTDVTAGAIGSLVIENANREKRSSGDREWSRVRRTERIGHVLPRLFHVQHGNANRREPC
jgi:hypothetical protein